MNLSIEFKKPVIKGAFNWQHSQEINVSADGQVVAKAEIELITMNKHRDASATFLLLDEQEATDWEIALNTYFKGHNLSAELCELLEVTPDNKAKTHIMLEAISVVAEHRKKGLAKYLLREIANKYPKVQSINLLSMPMNLFVDPQYCNGTENTEYYQQLDLDNESMAGDELTTFFVNSGFSEIEMDESSLAEPLQFEIFVATPTTILEATQV